MTAVPKPPKGKKKSASNSPKMTEDKALGDF